MAFDLDPDYKQVPERIADFREKHPEGSLRPLNPERPYEIVSVEGQTFIVYCAAAYRHPLDPAPGVGTAWELVPGKTPYTKLSELQNAETSAWGRAIVAVLASESKVVASAEDVRNRQADHAEPPARRQVPERLAAILKAVEELPAFVLADIRTAVWNGEPVNLLDLPESWWPHVEKMIAKARLGAGASTGPEPEGPEARAHPAVDGPASPPPDPFEDRTVRADPEKVERLVARVEALPPDLAADCMARLTECGIDLDDLGAWEFMEAASHIADFEGRAPKDLTAKANAVAAKARAAS